MKNNTQYINKEAKKALERQSNFRSNTLKAHLHSLSVSGGREDNEKAMKLEKQRILKNTSC